MTSCSVARVTHTRQAACLDNVTENLIEFNLPIRVENRGEFIIDASDFDLRYDSSYTYNCTVDDISWDYYLSQNSILMLFEFTRALSYAFADTSCQVNRSSLQNLFGMPVESSVIGENGSDVYKILIQGEDGVISHVPHHQIYIGYENDVIHNFIVLGTPCANINFVLQRSPRYRE